MPASGSNFGEKCLSFLVEHRDQYPLEDLFALPKLVELIRTGADDFPFLQSGVQYSALRLLCTLFYLNAFNCVERSELIKLGLVEAVLTLVSSHHLEVVREKKKKPVLEESTGCQCESTYHYPHYLLKLAVFVILSLCDSNSKMRKENFTVSQLHLTVIDQIPTIVSHWLRQSKGGIINIAILFYNVANLLKEKLLPNYENWVQVSIEGLAHQTGEWVRKYFSLALQALVPLAPLLLRNVNWKNSFCEKSHEETTLDFVGGVLLSNYPLLSERYFEGERSPRRQLKMNSRDLVSKLDNDGNTISIFAIPIK